GDGKRRGDGHGGNQGNEWHYYCAERRIVRIPRHASRDDQNGQGGLHSSIGADCPDFDSARDEGRSPLVKRKKPSKAFKNCWKRFGPVAASIFPATSEPRFAGESINEYRTSASASFPNT